MGHSEGYPQSDRDDKHDTCLLPHPKRAARNARTKAARAPQFERLLSFWACGHNVMAGERINARLGCNFLLRLKPKSMAAVYLQVANYCKVIRTSTLESRRIDELFSTIVQLFLQQVIRFSSHYGSRYNEYSTRRRRRRVHPARGISLRERRGEVQLVFLDRAERCLLYPKSTTGSTTCHTVSFK